MQTKVILTVIISLLNSSCLCNNPKNQVKDPRQPDITKPIDPLIKLTLVAQSNTALIGPNRDIKFIIQKELGNVGIDFDKLELGILQTGEDARLLYQGKEVKSAIPAKELPAVGQPVHFQVEPGQERKVNYTFQLLYGGNSIGNSLSFMWEHEGESLLEAIADKAKTPEEIEKLINPEAVKYQDEKGKTPLHHAIHRGDIAIVKKLLQQGAGLDVYNKRGNTPLLTALSKENKELAELLIKSGADVNLAMRNDEGWTPLIDAIFWEKTDQALIQLLLDNGASINQADSLGRTPLCWAIIMQEKDIAQLLIGKQADINQTCGGVGETPLLFAIKDIYNGSLVDKDKTKQLVKLLLAHGANPDLADNNGVTPLWKAVRKSDQAMVELLLNYGARASIHQVGKHGKTPLQLAQEKGLIAIVELLQKAK